MTMTYKITFADLGWYEVKAENRKEAEEVALSLPGTSTRSFLLRS